MTTYGPSYSPAGLEARAQILADLQGRPWFIVREPDGFAYMTPDPSDLGIVDLKKVIPASRYA